MFFTVGFALGALITKAVRKISTCCCAEYDLVNNSAEVIQISSETPANTLTAKTSEHCAFASVPEKELNLDVKPSYEDERISCETTANTFTVQTTGTGHCSVVEILDDIAHFFTEDSKTNQDIDDTLFFCKFPNLFNSCWFNAALQSILHLSVARKFGTLHPEKIFEALSATPLFADLLCSAMYHPGKYFSVEEIYQVLLEVIDNSPVLDFEEQINPKYFLYTIFCWLNPSVINTDIMMYSATTCEECQSSYFNINKLLCPILPLEDPVPYDSTISLLNRMVAKYEKYYCEVCDSDLKRKPFIDDNDMIVLYLERSVSQGDLRCPVIPSATIDIPVKGGSQLYRLSSVICSQSLSPETEHFYTYLMCGAMLYKAEDTQVTTSNKDGVADICHNGFIYIYEKYTEGDEEFSVWIKTTPEQENCNIDKMW